MNYPTPYADTDAKCLCLFRIRELSDGELLVLFQEVAKAPALSDQPEKADIPGGVFSRFSRIATHTTEATTSPGSLSCDCN